MKVYMDESNLEYFEALASQTRLQVLGLLAERDMNIKELADALDISSSIMTKHIRKLENARLITTANMRKDGSRQKVCSLLHTVTEVHMPHQREPRAAAQRHHETQLPVGLYTALDSDPPCGIATGSKIIGALDRPEYLFATERLEAQRLWLAGGFVEYTAPNYVGGGHRLTAVEFSAELGSDMEVGNRPSAVNFYLNRTPVCTFPVMGVEAEGQWPFNRHGNMTVVRVDDEGVTVNGEKRSDLTVEELRSDHDKWVIRLEAANPSLGGGISVFGEAGGIHGQNLIFRTYYL